VRLLGFVSDQQLGLAYRAADFSVVPTVALEVLDHVVESLAGTQFWEHQWGAFLRSYGHSLKIWCLRGVLPINPAQGILEALSGQRKLPSQECEATSAHYLAGDCWTNCLSTSPH